MTRGWVISFLCFYALLVSLALVLSNSIVQSWPKSVASPIPMIKLDLEELVSKEQTQSDPISYNNLLVYAVRINAISSSLNKAIKRSGLNLPPVKLRASELSYKDKRRSWFAVNDDFILIFLFKDISNTLDASEVLAVSVHELGHLILGHKNSNLTDKRDINYEKDADKLTVDSGIDPLTLISAISKLAADDEEKSERIATLIQLYRN